MRSHIFGISGIRKFWQGLERFQTRNYALNKHLFCTCLGIQTRSLTDEDITKPLMHLFPPVFCKIRPLEFNYSVFEGTKNFSTKEFCKAARFMARNQNIRPSLLAATHASIECERCEREALDEIK